MFQDLLVQLHALVSGLDPWQQLLALVPVGAIPFIESYLGSFLGTTLGIHPALAIPAPGTTPTPPATPPETVTALR